MDDEFINIEPLSVEGSLNREGFLKWMEAHPDAIVVFDLDEDEDCPDPE